MGGPVLHDQFSEEMLRPQMSVMDVMYNRATATLVAACREDAPFWFRRVRSKPRLKQSTMNLDGQIWISAFWNP